MRRSSSSADETDHAAMPPAACHLQLLLFGGDEGPYMAA
jgi:hypothetical protein